MKVRIYITLKQSVFDPQGEAIKTTIKNLNITGVNGARQGKLIELTLDKQEKSQAEAQIKEICEKLLVNTVIENYRFEITE